MPNESEDEGWGWLAVPVILGVILIFLVVKYVLRPWCRDERRRMTESGKTPGHILAEKLGQMKTAASGRRRNYDRLDIGGGNAEEDDEDLEEKVDLSSAPLVRVRVNVDNGESEPLAISEADDDINASLLLGSEHAAVRYSSRELEQLKMLDMAIEEEEALSLGTGQRTADDHLDQSDSHSQHKDSADDHMDIDADLEAAVDSAIAKTDHLRVADVSIEMHDVKSEEIDT